MEEQQLYRLQRIKRSTLESMLQPGEQLLWHGAPGTGIRFRHSELRSLPINLFILGFGIFWTVSAASSAGVKGILFGIPLLAFGVYLSIGRFLIEIRHRKETYYGITNQRIILMEPKTIQTLLYDQIPSLELEPEKNGEGTIYFSPQYVPTTDKRGRSTMALDLNRKGLLHIRDAVNVYNLIQNQMNALD